MTIKDVAEAAGVSPASVSIVIHGRKGVSDETRRRVQEVLDRTGYNRGQRRRDKRRRLVVVKYLTHGKAVEENQGFIAAISDQIESECRKYGYDLGVCNCHQADAAKTLTALMADPPDGVIFVATELLPENYGLLSLIQTPLLVLDNNMEGLPYDSLTMENVSIAGAAVRHLYEIGHRQISYYQFDVPIHNCQERYRGYLQEMERLGLAPEAPLALGATLHSAYEGMKRRIREGYVPHGAAVADNDTVAIGAMKAILEEGYRIPEDISLIGVDDIPYSAVTMPALTTMRISRHTMGVVAVDMLRKRMDHPLWPSLHTQLTGSLIVRKSTQAAEG